MSILVSRHNILFGTLPETNSSPLKMDGWNMLEYYFPIGFRPVFRGDGC